MPGHKPGILFFIIHQREGRGWPGRARPWQVVGSI